MGDEPWKIPEFSWQRWLSERGITKTLLHKIAARTGADKSNKLGFKATADKILEKHRTKPFTDEVQRYITRELCRSAKALKKAGGGINFILVPEEKADDINSITKSKVDRQTQENQR